MEKAIQKGQMTDSSIVEDLFVSIPRGGPMYISDMVGPLTRISEFQSTVEHELKDLRKELCLDLIEQHRPEISVDELKILSEEDLVDIAFDASLEDGNVTKNSSASSEEQCDRERDNSRMLDTERACSVSSRKERDIVPSDDFSKRSQSTNDNGKINRNVSKKRKTVTQKDTIPEEGFTAALEQLVRVKQKQEEEKSAARLHSFNGASGKIECVNLSSEKKEQMTAFQFTSYSTKARSASSRTHIPLHGPEILLCVEIYHCRRAWVKTQEIMVLGQQALTELRDKIDCLTDGIMKSWERHDPSGYFLIEDIFYNDLREACATDYSKPILDWLKNSKKKALEKWEYITSVEVQQKHKELLGNGKGNGSKLPQLKSRSMQATRFCDLVFRLGAGYLYCHQGDCKHLIVIRDMRLLNGEDVMNRAAYPMIMYHPKLRYQKCTICKIFKAEKVTVDDKWALENPCYFCGTCYFMLHYQNNKLIYDDFLVYDYIHD